MLKSSEEKIAAIDRVITDHKENLAVIKGANIDKGYEIMLIEAAYSALKQKLIAIFS